MRADFWPIKCMSSVVGIQLRDLQQRNFHLTLKALVSIIFTPLIRKLYIIISDIFVIPLFWNSCSFLYSGVLSRSCENLGFSVDWLKENIKGRDCVQPQYMAYTSCQEYVTTVLEI